MAKLHWSCYWVNAGENGLWWLYPCNEEAKYITIMHKSLKQFHVKALFIIAHLWAAAVAAASMANCRIVLSSRYFCSQRVMSASRARMCSSLSLSRCCKELTFRLDVELLIACWPWACHWTKTKMVSKKKTQKSQFVKSNSWVRKYLLCPEALQLLLKSGAKLHLQSFPFLTCSLKLGQSTLQPFHLLHVCPLFTQLFLQLSVPCLSRHQSLL